MKQINDLLVLSVEKWWENFRILEADIRTFRQTLLYAHPKAHPLFTGRIPLPPGQYEIIGLIGKLQDGDIDTIISASGTQFNNIYELLTNNGINYIGNLLFLKKLN